MNEHFSSLKIKTLPHATYAIKKSTGCQSRSCWVQTKILETCFVSTIKANFDVNCDDGDSEKSFSEMLDLMSRFISYVKWSYRHAA